MMKIALWGVRGSFPVPGDDTVKYGGNTSCVSIEKEVDGKIKRLIIDCGTGAIKLGKTMIKNFFAGKEDISNIIMIFTHLHPDHTQGFPFFGPNYFSEATIHLLGMETLKKNVGIVLQQEMLPPTFPIEYKDLKSKRMHYKLKDEDQFYVAKDGSVSTKETSDPLFLINVMQAFSPSHPQQGAMYYKITDPDTGKSAACIWDIESHPGGDQRVIKFFKDCDVMIHDTQYTLDEYNSSQMIVQGFGHSTYEMAIENAEKSGIKEKLICFHYNPQHDDTLLDTIQEKFSNFDKPFDIILGREGMEIEV